MLNVATPQLTSRSTGRAISLAFIFNVPGAPVISGVRRFQRNLAENG
jgi:hypothetical protein